MESVIRALAVTSLIVFLGASPGGARAAPADTHKCFTAWQGETYELEYSISQDDPESPGFGKAVQGTVIQLDPDTLIFNFTGVTRRGTRAFVVDTPDGPLYRSTTTARVTTDAFGATGSVTFRRLHNPFNPDIARLTISGTTIDFGCDLSQFGL